MTLPEPSLEELAPEAVRERLNRQYGEPWELTPRGRPSAISEEWWAGWIKTDQNVIYDHDDEALYLWDSLLGIYRPISPPAMVSRISFILLDASRTCRVPELAAQRKLPRLKTVAEFLRGAADVHEPFVSREPILALENGIIEINAKHQIQFREFNPKYRIRHKATVAYDPEAEVDLFLREFINPMFGEDDRDLLQRQLGLVLLGQNPAQRMGIFEGESSAGKTTLANLMTILIGDERVCQLRTGHLDNQFELDAFRGRSLLLGNDVGQKFLNTLGADALKGLVSTDLYHPEAKNRRDRRPLRGPFNVLIGTNCKLTYRNQGDSDAWRRRIILYDCHAQEGRKKIPDFEKLLLRREGSGIVNWLLAGLRRAWREIEDIGDLAMTPEQKDRVDKLILRSDTVATFVDRMVTDDKYESVLSSDMVEAYARFCRARDWVPIPEKIFLEKIGHVLLERFGRPRAHDLQKDGKKSLRGWRFLKLQKEQVEFAET